MKQLDKVVLEYYNEYGILEKRIEKRIPKRLITQKEFEGYEPYKLYFSKRSTKESPFNSLTIVLKKEI